MSIKENSTLTLSTMEATVAIEPSKCDLSKLRCAISIKNIMNYNDLMKKEGTIYQFLILIICRNDNTVYGRVKQNIKIHLTCYILMWLLRAVRFHCMHVLQHG